MIRNSSCRQTCLHIAFALESIIQQKLSHSSLPNCSAKHPFSLALCLQTSVRREQAIITFFYAKSRREGSFIKSRKSNIVSLLQRDILLACLAIISFTNSAVRTLKRSIFGVFSTGSLYYRNYILKCICVYTLLGHSKRQMFVVAEKEKGIVFPTTQTCMSLEYILVFP